MRIAVVAAVAATAIVVLVLVWGEDGDDSPSSPARPGLEQDKQTLVEFPPKKKIERTGNEWARLVAASDDRAACELMTQFACERITCERITGPVENCSPPSVEFRESFRGATIEDVAITGDDRAGAVFSNGEPIVLFRREGPYLKDPEIGASWLIDDVGGEAGRRLLGGGATPRGE